MPESRLSFNQMTAGRHSLAEVVEGCVQAAIPSVGVWRYALDGVGAQAAGQMLRDAGLGVSSLCRGGMFPAATAPERQKRLDDNRRAVEEAAALGTDLLVLVCGPAPDRDLGAARAMVSEGLDLLLPYAKACGVRLGLEPLHPMFCGDRSVVVTLAQARQMAGPFDPRWLGVVVDAYHVWWDPEVEGEIAALNGRISAFHVSDWIVPTPDMLMGRGLPGDGVIDLPSLRALTDAAGYDGPIEVEIFNEALWSRPCPEICMAVADRFRRHVLAD